MDFFKDHELKDDKFRLQHKKVHLTYPGRFILDDLLDHIKNVVNSDKREIEKYSIVLEKKDSYEHTHVLLGFSSEINSRSCKIFDYKGFHPNIAVIKTLNHWNNAILYHYKDPTEILTNINPTEIDPKKKKDKKLTLSSKPLKEVADTIHSYDSMSQVINNVQDARASDISFLTQIFKHKPRELLPEEPIRSWRTWQQELYDEIQTRPNDRDIIWYVDLLGSAGKSNFTRHFETYIPDTFSSSSGALYHLSTVAMEHYRDGGGFKQIFFDISREEKIDSTFYASLEAFKNGKITAKKYVGKTLMFEHPHIIVFSNSFPDLDKLSVDRWDVRILNDKYSVEKNIKGLELKEYVKTNSQKSLRTYWQDYNFI